MGSLNYSQISHQRASQVPEKMILPDAHLHAKGISPQGYEIGLTLAPRCYICVSKVVVWMWFTQYFCIRLSVRFYTHI